MDCDNCKVHISGDNFELTYQAELLCQNCYKDYISRQKWYCYILKSLDTNHKNRTYNGCTNNPKKRLRQHNGEICGGAKSTKKGRPYEIYCLITGFKNMNEALKCEWRIKHPDKKKKRSRKFCGINGRINGLNHLLGDIKFTSNSEDNIENMELTIWIIKEKAYLLKNIPKNTNLVVVDSINTNLINQ